MTEPANDNPGSNNSRRPSVVAVFVLSALIVVFLAIRADNNAAAPPEKAAPETTAIATPPDSGAIDPAAITAWQRAAASQNIDITLYNALYVQDARTYSVLLAPKDDAVIPTYEIIVERGSNRVMSFNLAR
jgi:long-subunit fatty acid transport protein